MKVERIHFVGRPTGRYLASAHVYLGNGKGLSLMVKLRIVEVKKRRILVMPSITRRTDKGEQRVEVFHPTNKETREWLESVVLDTYEKQHGPGT